MTWNTMKYREISEIFARFAILTKFLSIEFLQTWQLSKTSEVTTFGWVLWNFYVPIWRYDLKHNEISWNQRNFCHICNFNQVFVDRIPSNLTIIKNTIRHNFWMSFVIFLRANLKIWLETQWNIVKSAKFLPDCQSENMTWKTMKYREISKILPDLQFWILTKFLSIEFL